MEPIKKIINKGSVRKDLKSFLRSLAVLLLAVMIIFGTTVAWIEGGKLASTLGQNCTVEAGAGLQFIGFDKEVQNGKITLPTSEVLEDCSSVDGRNIFIPTVGSIQSPTPGTVSTQNLKFRSAVESDKNTKYITQDFIIKSLEGTSSGSGTPIYIGTGSSFSSTADSNKAFRMSINFNDGSDPVVVCPGLVLETEKRSYSPVSGIRSDGVADPTPTDRQANAMAMYYYGKTPIFTLPPGESRRVTVTLWLEGTDTDCTKDIVEGKDIKLNLVLSTQDENMRTVTFVDHTPSTWVGMYGSNVFVVDQDNTSATYAMSKSADGTTYTARIPKNINNIYFQKTAASETVPGEQTLHNSWSFNEDDNLDVSSTYYAIGRGTGDGAGGSYDDKNYGYWVDPDCTGVITVTFTDKNGTYRAAAGAYPYIYVFGLNYYGGGTDKNLLGKGWTGFHMDRIGETNNYKFVIPAVKGATINFNGGSDSNQVEFKEGTNYTVNDQNANYEFSFSN